MTVENKKEIESLKKGLERDERKISGIKKEEETELAAPNSEKAVEKAVVHVPKNR